MRRFLVVAVFLLGSPTGASAGPGWSKSFANRPIWAPTGKVVVEGDTLGFNLSKNSAFNPVYTAPDILWGYQGRLNFVMRHERGICWNSGCRTHYNDVGLGARYGLLHGGTVSIAGEGLLAIPGFDDFGMGLELKGEIRLQFLQRDALAIHFTPGIYLGLAEDEQYPSRLRLPFSFRYRFKPHLEGQLNFGWYGILDNFSDTVRIPVGFALNYSITYRVDLGAELSFDNMFGRGATFNSRRFILRLGLIF